MKQGILFFLIGCSFLSFLNFEKKKENDLENKHSKAQVKTITENIYRIMGKEIFLQIKIITDYNIDRQPIRSYSYKYGLNFQEGIFQRQLIGIDSFKYEYWKNGGVCQCWYGGKLFNLVTNYVDSTGNSLKFINFMMRQTYEYRRLTSRSFYKTMSIQDRLASKGYNYADTVIDIEVFYKKGKSGNTWKSEKYSYTSIAYWSIDKFKKRGRRFKYKRYKYLFDDTYKANGIPINKSYGKKLIIKRYLKYNKKGELIKHNVYNFEPIEPQYEYRKIDFKDKYRYKKYDEKGNWQNKSQYRNGKLYTITERTIEYY